MDPKFPIDDAAKDACNSYHWYTLLFSSRLGHTIFFHHPYVWPSLGLKKSVAIYMLLTDQVVSRVLKPLVWEWNASPTVNLWLLTMLLDLPLILKTRNPTQFSPLLLDNDKVSEFSAVLWIRLGLCLRRWMKERPSILHYLSYAKLDQTKLYLGSLKT